MGRTKRGKHFRRIMTEESSVSNIFNLEEGQEQEDKSMPKKIPVLRTHDHQESRKKCTINMSATMQKPSSKDQKMKSFMKAYGGGDTKQNPKE